MTTDPDPDSDPTDELEKACHFRDFARLRALAEAGITIDLIAGDGPLHGAAGDNDTELVRALLEIGCPVALGTFDESGCTPLHLAALGGQREAAELLIAAGADVNAHDEPNLGETPLDLACREADAGLIRLLLDHGADPAIRTWMGMTATDRLEQLLENDHVSLASPGSPEETGRVQKPGATLRPGYLGEELPVDGAVPTDFDPDTFAGQESELRSLLLRMKHVGT